MVVRAMVVRAMVLRTMVDRRVVSHLAMSATLLESFCLKLGASIANCGVKSSVVVTKKKAKLCKRMKS